MTEILEARLDDRAAIITLWELAGLTRPWNDPVADFDRAFNAPHASVVKYVSDGNITGTLMMGEDGHRGWVYYLATHPDHLRKGIGRALMAHAEAWLKQRGTPKSQLMVRSDNDKALGFYKSLGYEVQTVTTLGRFLNND